MTKRVRNILAIDPGLHNLGVAVLNSKGDLRFSSVITTSPKDPLPVRFKNIKQRITEFLDFYQPQVMVIEATWQCKNPSLKAVHRVAKLCERQAQTKRINAISVPSVTVRRDLTGYGRSGKRELATVVTSHFPELRIYLRQDKAWKETHFSNLFDAVALGLYFLNRSRK